MIMARGRKKKIQDSGEKDVLENKIYDAPVHIDEEVSEGFSTVEPYKGNTTKYEFTN